MKASDIIHDNNLQNTFWGERIIKAEKRGRFTLKDHKLAEDWQTCACGEQDNRIPRGNKGASPARPDDSRLACLGGDFYMYVSRSMVSLAANTLVKIEKRAAEVLAQVLKEEKENG